MTRTKAAVIRDPDAPQFQAADMWLECCGGRVYISRARYGSAYKPGEIRCPACLAVYDARGFVLVEGMSSC